MINDCFNYTLSKSAFRHALWDTHMCATLEWDASSSCIFRKIRASSWNVCLLSVKLVATHKRSLIPGGSPSLARARARIIAELCHGVAARFLSAGLVRYVMLPMRGNRERRRALAITATASVTYLVGYRYATRSADRARRIHLARRDEGRGEPDPDTGRRYLRRIDKILPGGRNPRGFAGFYAACLSVFSREMNLSWSRKVIFALE